MYNNTVTSQEPTATGGQSFVPPPNPEFNSPNAATATAESASVIYQEEPKTSASRPPERRESPLVALQHRDFRLLWVGGFLSQVGSQMRIVAVGVQLWDLTGSYAALGLLGVFRLTPPLLLSLFGCVLADAIDRLKPL